METVRRIQRALLAVALVLAVGTVGYVMLGFSPVEALYQTVTTVATVGFREVHPLGTAGQVFTMALILAGAGTMLYTFGVLLEALIEGHLRQHLRERRMARDIAKMTDHVIICGLGRVGRACAAYLNSIGQQTVIIDRDPERFTGVENPHVVGDVTDDNVLNAAGIAHARALIASLDADADNVYVTLSSRALRPDLRIIARARNDGSKSTLVRAGANRAVNPQLIGGRRMATFALQPHVAEFLDGVLHDESLDYRIEQVEIAHDSRLVGQHLRDTSPGDGDGALPLAVRQGEDGEFLTNPSPATRLEPGSILIVVGTAAQLDALRRHATP
ncbi:MAG: potassium channel family protein [Micromonosporaceae bacterium]